MPLSDSRLARRLLLIALLLLALAVGLWQPLELAELMTLGEQYATRPLTIVLVILAQAVLLALALPGSMVLWVVAPFHAPPVATAILLAGSVPGALGGYFIAHRLGSDWRPPAGAWLIDLLRQRGDFLTQCALRVLPGCPHWAATYGAGILRLPLLPFTLAAAVGLGIKWAMYSWAIYGAATAARAEEEGFDPATLLPMVILAVFLVLGSLARQRMVARRNGPDSGDQQGSGR